jgi:hypothetical protein
MRKTVFFLSAVMLTAIPLCAQSGRQNGDRTIEELYLQRQQTIESLSGLAHASDRETRLIAIEELERMEESGRITAQDTDFIAILDYLALDGTAIISSENNRKIQNFPEVRMLACRLLARIGGPQAERTLRTVVNVDRDPVVLAEAVYGLGAVSEDKDNRVLPAIADLITKQDILAPDNNLAYASLLAIEKIVQKTRRLGDPEILRAVIRLMLPESIYVSEVKQKAREVFEVLRQNL